MFSCMRGMWIMIILVLAWPHPGLAAETSAQRPENVKLWQPGDPGERFFLRGRVVGSDGRGLAGALVYFRQTDGTGAYRERYSGQLQTSGDGAFSMATVLPGRYGGPRHIHVAVDHPNYPLRELRIVFKGDPYLNQARPGDLPILLEETHQDGEKVWVGDVELVLGTGGTN